MKRTLVIGIAAITVACGGSRPAEHNDRSAGTAAAQPPTSTSAQPGTAAENAQQPAAQAVTLVGCLQGPPLAAATGTSGTRARARATGTQPSAPAVAGGATGDRYTLVDATPASPDGAGVGANGAGASGGPLVSGRSSFDLDGLPADARAHVNKQVQIAGRIDPRPDSLPGAESGAGAARAVDGRGAAADSNGAASGRPGAGVGSPSGANATAGAAGSATGGVASGTRSGAAPAGSQQRRLIVESVQVIAQNCARQP